MAKATKLPSGSYRVQACVTVDGRKIKRSFTAETARKAEYLALEWQENLRSEAADSENYTIEKAIEEYIKIKDGVLSPSTIRGYHTILNNSISEIAHIKLTNLSRVRLQSYINELSKTKSPKTVRNIYGLITAVYALYAPDYSIGRITLPQKQPPKERALTQQEITSLLSAVVGHRNEIPILLALWLGLRQSEIFALEWSDIDLGNDTVYIHRAKVPDRNHQYVIKETTKNVTSTRTLHLPSYLKEKMLKVEKREGLVYKYSASVLGRDLKKLLDSVGIADISLHDLRRTMATIGVSLNIADKIMMARGGWSNPQTMKNIYQKVQSDDVLAATIAIEEHLSSFAPKA